MTGGLGEIGGEKRAARSAARFSPPALLCFCGSFRLKGGISTHIAAHLSQKAKKSHKMM